MQKLDAQCMCGNILSTVNSPGITLGSILVPSRRLVHDMDSFYSVPPAPVSSRVIIIISQVYCKR